MLKELAFRMFSRTASILKRHEDAIAKIPGVPSAYRWLYRRVKPRGFVQVNVEGANLWVRAEDEGVARPLLLTGSFERDETELVKTVLRPGMRVLDIGANIGYYTVLASRLVGNSGHVFAFEPEPSNHAILAKNLADNRCENVTALRLALSDRTGTANLFVDGSNLGNPSICDTNVPDKTSSVEVETTTVDRFVDDHDAWPIDFVKIDVQGAEELVLSGAKKLLEQPRLMVLIEIWPEGLRNLGTDALTLLENFAAHGYRMRPVSRTSDASNLTASEVMHLISQSKDGFVNLLLFKQ